MPKTIQKVAQKNDAFPPFFIRQNPNSVSRALFNTISTQPPTRPRQGSRFGGVCHVESSIVGVPSRRSTFPVYSWYCTRYFSVLIIIINMGAYPTGSGSGSSFMFQPRIDATLPAGGDDFFSESRRQYMNMIISAYAMPVLYGFAFTRCAVLCIPKSLSSRA